MTAKEFKRARKKLGLSAAGMARALKLESKWSDRTIRYWEAGTYPVPGPIEVAVNGLLAAAAK